MDSALIFVLSIFGFYSVLGLVPLWFAYCSSSRAERIAIGLAPMYLAAFLLTGIGLVTGLIQRPGWMEELKPGQAQQIADFKQYILFFGAIFTLLFGGVGVNVFTSGLIPSATVEALDTLRRIEKKTDENLALSKETRGKNRLLAFANVGALVVLTSTLIAIWVW